MIKSAFAFVLCLDLIICELQPYIQNGEDADIKAFSYTVCLQTHPCICPDGTPKNWICGASVLNQRILLTAAHCVFGCTRRSTMTIRYGNADRRQATFVFILQYDTHMNYREHSTYCDIAVVKVSKPIWLNQNCGRVAIYPKMYTPYGEVGKVAGWGLIHEVQKVSSSKLQYITQKIMKKTACEMALGKMIPPGVICGGEKNSKSFASQGDSGSALVVRNYIQVGLVAYKNPSVSQSIVMYTDVGYFYDWIMEKAFRLYCGF